MSYSLCKLCLFVAVSPCACAAFSLLVCQHFPLLLPAPVVWFYVLSLSLVVFGLPLPCHRNPPCACKWWCARFHAYWGLFPDSVKSHFKLELSSGVLILRIWPLIREFVSLSAPVVSALMCQISCVYVKVLSAVFIPCWFLCEHLLFSELKSLLYPCIQRGVMSAGKTGVGRLEMNNMPVTALMTVWPEETVVPTTRHCVKVCNYKCVIHV